MLEQLQAREELRAAVSNSEPKRLAKALRRAKAAGLCSATLLQAKGVLHKLNNRGVEAVEAPQKAGAAPVAAIGTAQPHRWRRRTQSVQCITSVDTFCAPKMPGMAFTSAKLAWGAD